VHMLDLKAMYLARVRADDLVVGPRLRLFCFPYAGGGTAGFWRWHARLPSHIELRPVVLPGRESMLGEAPFTRLTPLVDSLVKRLGPSLDAPFSFLGHSMGALVAFELARRLRAVHATAPLRLFVVAYPAPHLAQGRPSAEGLDDAALIERVRQLDGMPEEALNSDEVLRLTLPTLRADLSVCDTYIHVPDVALGMPISCFVGRHDSAVSVPSVRAWSIHTTQEFSLRVVAGGHFLSDVGADEMLQGVRNDLERDLVAVAGHQLRRDDGNNEI
jgi:medium-chain acyl-[acyl-carrier-protein] hydrolase